MERAKPSELVVDYDPVWPIAFQEIRKRIEPVLVDVATSVEHVGSTAVPGLAAKPLIDIDVVVSRRERVPRAIELLVSIGYVYQGDLGVAGREAFLPPNEWPHHHLYLVIDGSEPYRNHIDLRDHLRRHPADVSRYSARKRAIAPLLTTDREAYVAAKSHLIDELLERARE